MKRIAPLAVLPAAALALAAMAAGPARADVEDRLQRKTAEAVEALYEFLGEKSEIPRDLLGRAECVMVLPDVAKGALGIGGRYGKGLVSCRDGNGWTAPSFLEIGGVSVGWQVGGEVTDHFILVMNDEGMEWLLKDEFKLGAEASIAAGPVGRTGQAATDVALQAGMLSWSRSRGAFVGASVEGAVLKQEKSDNRHAYGRRVTARALLQPVGSEIRTPEMLRPFILALSRTMPPPSD